MSAAAGIVVTEMKTPMSAPVRASTRETTPTIPASVATTMENTFGVLIRSDTGRTPTLNASDSQPNARTTTLKTKVDDDRDQEADEERGGAGADPVAVALVDAERDADDRRVLRARRPWRPRSGSASS